MGCRGKGGRCWGGRFLSVRAPTVRPTNSPGLTSPRKRSCLGRHGMSNPPVTTQIVSVSLGNRGGTTRPSERRERRHPGGRTPPAVGIADAHPHLRCTCGAPAQRLAARRSERSAPADDGGRAAHPVRYRSPPRAPRCGAATVGHPGMERRLRRGPRVRNATSLGSHNVCRKGLGAQAVSGLESLAGGCGEHVCSLRRNDDLYVFALPRWLAPVDAHHNVERRPVQLADSGVDVGVRAEFFDENHFGVDSVVSGTGES